MAGLLQARLTHLESVISHPNTWESMTWGFYGRLVMGWGPYLETILCAISHLIIWLNNEHVLWPFLTCPCTFIHCYGQRTLPGNCFMFYVIYEDPIWKLYSDSLVEAEMARRAQCSFLAQSCLTHQPSSKVFLDVEVIMCILFNLQLFCQVGWRMLIRGRRWRGRRTKVKRV